MSLTDMLFERIHRFIPVFLMLAGVLFAYALNKCIFRSQLDGFSVFNWTPVPKIAERVNPFLFL